MLVDDRVIRRRDDGEWELMIDADAVDVPPTIQSLLGARVERLPGAEREVLELASVIGAEFSLGALRELVGDRAAVASLLEAMRRKELVEPTGTYWGDQPVHRFHHVLIRDAAYRRLLKARRAELHERVAVWTDREAAGLVGEHEAATAFHYEQAYRYRAELGTLDEHTEGLGRRAAELLATGAQRALGRNDLSSAGTLSARALALLPEADAAARGDLLQMGCECLLGSGNGAAAKPLVEELGRSAAGDRRLAAWADCYAAQLVGLTDPDALVTAEARAAAAADVLAELGDGSGQAKAHQVRAGLLARLGRIGDAEQELDLALAAARAADDWRRVTAVLGAAPDAALFGPSPVARAGGRCLDVVRLLRITTASPAVEAASTRCQAVLEALRGRFDVARTMLASAQAVFEDLGLRHGIAQTEQYAGIVELIAGDPHAAIQPLRAAYEDLGALGVGADAGNAAALLARALLVDGDVDEADDLAAASEHLAGQNLKTAIGWRVARAEVLAARGALADAVATAEAAVRIGAGTDLVLDHADACAALATIRARAGDDVGSRAARLEARRLYEQKGATVHAERLADADTSTGGPDGGTDPSDHEPRQENAASRTWARLFAALGSRDHATLVALFAPGYRYDDRRRVVSLGELDRTSAAELLGQFVEEGWNFGQPKTIAIRGERLVLVRHISRTAADNEIAQLNVAELDEAGRIVACVTFDEADLMGAIDELDARFMTGEGAEHAHLVEVINAGNKALTDRDFHRFRALAAPLGAVIDHRGVEGHLTTDLDSLIEVQRAYDDVPMTTFACTMRLSAHAALTATVTWGVDTHGTEVAWIHHQIIGFDAAGRATRAEMFDERDRDAAEARFEELAAAGAHHPDLGIENPATRQVLRCRELLDAGRADDAIAMLAEDFVRRDRRTTVSFPDMDRREYVEWDRSVYDHFDAIRLEPLAIRGERLCVLRVVLMRDDFESAFVMLVRVDDAGLIVEFVNFDDEDDLTAIDELDGWHVEGEGVADAEVLTAYRTFMRLHRAEDWEGLRGQLAPDFAFVDHRPLPWPRSDAGGLLRLLGGRVEQAPDIRNRVRNIVVRGRAALLDIDAVGTDEHGGIQEWQFLSVGLHDAAGLMRRLEWFASEQRDDALVRLDELATVEDGIPTDRPVNGVTRALDRFFQLANDGRWDEAAELLSPDIVRKDHRRAVADATAVGRDAYLAAFRGTFEVGFTTAAVEHLAIRGHRLALIRSVFASDTGSELVTCSVVELDEDGRFSFISLHEPEDLTVAGAELDERYAVDEGARTIGLENAAVRALGRMADALGHGDREALSDLYSEDTVSIDRRSGVNSGLVAGRDAILDLVRGFEHIGLLSVRDDVLALRGQRVALVRRRLKFVTGFEMTHLAFVEVDADERISRGVLFDEDDLDAAVQELEDRTCAGATVREALAVRRLGDHVRAFARRDWDALSELYAPAHVFTDHRQSPSPHDTFPALLRAAMEDAPDSTLLYRTVEHRGDAGMALLALLPDAKASSPAAMQAWAVWRSVAGAVESIDLYDPGDEASARVRFEELADADPRTLYIDNDAVRVFDRAHWLGLHGDPVAAHALTTEDIVAVDRRRAVSSPATSDRQDFGRGIRSVRETFPHATYEPLAVRGDRLVLLRINMFTDDGFEIPHLGLYEIDDALLISRVTTFDEANLVEALEAIEARHRELLGDAYSPVERDYMDLVQAFNRGDRSRFFGALAPGYRVIDHGPLGFGITDADGLRAQLELLDGQAQVVECNAKRYVSPNAVLAVVPILGVTDEGIEIVWQYATVRCNSDGGLVAEDHAFQIEQWDDALAVFDAWTATVSNRDGVGGSGRGE